MSTSFGRRFGGRGPFNPQSRIYNREMGGGGILDLGCYTASAVRRFAGAAEGKLVSASDCGKSDREGRDPQG